jgi:hypothetical protein
MKLTQWIAVLCLAATPLLAEADLSATWQPLDAIQMIANYRRTSPELPSQERLGGSLFFVRKEGHAWRRQREIRTARTRCGLPGRPRRSPTATSAATRPGCAQVENCKRKCSFPLAHSPYYDGDVDPHLSWKGAGSTLTMACSVS